mmetsp:Transcript_3242/g.7663  ORF Transcript_3242/g.7663 Transcript_3242/m.7663 type:complete len:807 (+) Transcript_3242:31-2451(+)
MGQRGSTQQVTEKVEDSPRAKFASRGSRSGSGGSKNRGSFGRSFSSLDLLGKGKKTEEIETFLGQVPLLKCLPKAKLHPLAEAAEQKKFQAGQVVIKEGEEGHSFFIVYSGEAEVVKGGGEDEEEETIIVLAKGDYFGERALLTMDVRGATVKAESPLVVLEIYRHTFDDLGLKDELDFRGRNAIHVHGHHTVNLKTPTPKTPAEIEFILDSLSANPNISQFLQVHSIPQLADPAWKEDITVGEVVIRQGDPEADYFYVIKSGEFAIIVDGKVVGHVKTGQCFGELSLLYAAPRTATIKATKNSTIWVLPRGWVKTAAQQSAQSRAQMLMVYLNHVKALSVLLQDEKQLLAPLLTQCTMHQNDKIVGFTEEEQSLYILTDGEARVVENNDEVLEVSAGLTGTGLQIHTFCEKALRGPGNASERSVKIKSPKATCYRLDGVDFISIFGSYTELIRQTQRGFDFAGLENNLDGTAVDTSNLLSLRKKDLRKLCNLRSGQFGSLELWHHTGTGEPFMIKSVSKGYIVEQGLQDRIIKERDIMLMFDNAFLIKLLQTFAGDQTLYFLMETALGGDLYSVYLKNFLHGSNRHAQFYTAGLVMALEYIHNRKVAYRDLKPENVFLAQNGYVKLVNFGLAKVVSGRTYTIVGTPEYLAPEIIGVFGHNQGVDWWALGIFLFECLAGRTPFEDTNPLQTFGKAMAGIEQVTFPSKVNAAAERLIRALLKRDPGRRLPMKAGGAGNVRHADYFVGFDWRELKAQTMKPPLLPTLQSNTDTSNFNTEEQAKAPAAPFKDDGSGWDKAFPIFGIQAL